MKTSKSSIVSAALAIIGAAGVVATAVMAVKATPKATAILEARKKELNTDKLTVKETVKSAWKCYIPAAAIGASTIACVLGANCMSRRNQASLASAYALVSTSFGKYKGKVKELFGEETHNAVMDAVVKEEVKETHITSSCLFGCSTLEIDEGNNPEVVRTFYDAYSGRYFESTLSKVIEAEYHFNRNFVLGGGEAVNGLYEFLGLEPIDKGDDIGWTIEDEFYWVDFNHRKTVLDGGMEVVIIETDIEPRLLSDEERYF